MCVCVGGGAGGGGAIDYGAMFITDPIGALKAHAIPAAIPPTTKTRSLSSEQSPLNVQRHQEPARQHTQQKSAETPSPKPETPGRCAACVLHLAQNGNRMESRHPAVPPSNPTVPLSMYATPAQGNTSGALGWGGWAGGPVCAAGVCLPLIALP